VTVPIYASSFTGAGTAADPRIPAAAYGAPWYRTASINNVAFSNVPVHPATLPNEGIDPLAADSIVYLGETLDSPMLKAAVTSLKSKHGVVATIGETPRQLATRLGVVFGGRN
jgi:hypothetical protein